MNDTVCCGAELNITVSAKDSLWQNSLLPLNLKVNCKKSVLLKATIF